MPRSATNRFSRRLFFLVCLLGFAGQGRLAASNTAPKQKPKEVVLNLEQQWRNATLAGDAGALDRLLSDDYVGISWTGQASTKAMQLDRVRNRTLLLTRLDLTDVKVKVVGPIAIVTSTAQIEGSNDGAELRGTFRYTRIYQRLPFGAWKITNFEATRVPSSGQRPESPRHQKNSAP